MWKRCLRCMRLTSDPDDLLAGFILAKERLGYWVLVSPGAQNAGTAMGGDGDRNGTGGLLCSGIRTAVA